ncbi:MAG: cytochrome c oxidase subunit 4 [Actinobacteria bacterium]|jgi:divalent metal cation (Fe/Co/Zn/Cd) transporter|nr:cytochrome c oxidase subunit 4 [Actinomycetota bacterium]
MKFESLILLGIGIFFGIIAVIYWFTSYEDAGTMMLVGSFLLGLLPGSYYFFWHRRMSARPEDRDDASIADGAGVVQSFPGSSIWPFVLGMGAFVSVLSFVFGIWLILPGAGVIITALIGVTAESRRGGTV